MLFIHPGWRGQGLGKQLTEFAICELQTNKVDVNEPTNRQLVFTSEWVLLLQEDLKQTGWGNPNRYC
jgi:GNAT superfamily N-acetyltransferase